MRNARVEKMLDDCRDPANLTSIFAPNITNCMNVMFLDSLDEENDGRKYKGEAAPGVKIHKIVNFHPQLFLH